MIPLTRSFFRVAALIVFAGLVVGSAYGTTFHYYFGNNGYQEAIYNTPEALGEATCPAKYNNDYLRVEQNPAWNTGSSQGYYWGNLFCETSNGTEQGVGIIGAIICPDYAGQLWFAPYFSCPAEPLDDADEDDGCSPATSTSNPCNVATGNKYRSETDISDGSLSFTRSYNSRNLIDLGLGKGWRSNHQKRLFINGNSLTQISGTGKGEPWVKSEGVWQGEADSKVLITKVSGGYELARANGAIENYNNSGQLTSIIEPSGQQTSYTYNVYTDLESVTNEYGQSLTFAYTNRRLTSVTVSSGEVYSYEYDANDNLAAVVYPDETPGTTADNPRKIYHYEDLNFRNHLTGITDENGDRYATFSYQPDGLVSTSELATTTNAQGQEKITITYGQNGERTVSDAVGTQVDWTIQKVLGSSKLLTKIHASDTKGVTQTFDTNGNLETRTDAEGRITKYFYNTTNQKTSMVEAYGTPLERTTTYEYVSPDIDLVTKVISPSVLTGNLKTVTTGYTPELNVNEIKIEGYSLQGVSVTRITSFQHDALGNVTQIDGPRTDVSDITTLEYYPACDTGAECGQLEKVTNALGQVTTYDDYDSAARLKQSTDANGVVTTYTYHPRGWLATITQTPPTGSLPDDTPRITSYQYDNVGQLTEVTQPDGSKQHYVYDAAHNLREIYDDLGNKVEYKYDPRGNRTEELIKDPNGVLELSITTTYDSRNFVETVNRGGSITQSVNDAVGNLDTQTDPKLNPATDYGYDALDRLTNVVDALSNTASYQYDVADNVNQVTAPNNATTQYEHDDLGNLTKETSPDRGVVSYTHDATGNIATMTDARGVVTSYGYDALNRLSSITYPQIGEDVIFTYDQGTDCGAALGRLCQIVDATGIHGFTYDAWGNVLKQTFDTGSTLLQTQYAYDANNRITQVIYPSGLVVDYLRDTIGRVSAVHSPASGQTEIIADQFAYRADGQIKSARLGNAQILTRNYDAQGRLDDQWLDGVQLSDFAYDANGNVTNLIDTDQQRGFEYDVLDRLEVDDLISGVTGFDWEFDYDANGNRTTTEKNGVSSILTYSPNSNRLTSIGSNNPFLDASGNTTSLTHNGSTLTLNYNQQNHLVSVDKGGLITTYTYNHQRQRLTKQAAGATTHYIYDLGGRLLATTDADGVVHEEYLYANQSDLNPIHYRLYEDTEANTVEASHALERSAQSIADPVDSSGQCQGYERTEADRNNSNALSFDNGTSGTLIGGSTMFEIPTQNIGWLVPILLWYLDDEPIEIIDLDNPDPDPEPIDGSDVIVVWTPPSGTPTPDYVVDVATSKRSLNNRPDVARHCIQPGQREVQLNHIPLNGTKVYVRLWSKDNGVWSFEDFEFETQGNANPKDYVTRTYLINDHLDTPRFGYDDEQTLTWRWASDAFGQQSPNDDPDLDGVQANLNLRFPGQYEDYETGLYYNWNRYYDPKIGRYVTSDPIGLDGGLNTFGYVGGNPLSYIDAEGLFFRPGPLLLPKPRVQTPSPKPQSTAPKPKAPSPSKPARPSFPTPTTGDDSAAPEQCDDNGDDCKKRLSDWLLQALGIDAHAEKRELNLPGPDSRYELCGCKDGRIVVKRIKCKGPIVEETGLFWVI